MLRFLLFSTLILFFSCKGNKTEKLDDVEIVFYKDGRTSVYIGEDFFENQEANSLNTEGVNLAKEGYFEQAKNKFLGGLEIEPDNPCLINNLGNAEHELKNYKSATSTFERSLTISDSTYLNAGLNLGLLYWKDYEFEKSAKILEYVLSKSKKKYEIAAAHLQLARTYLDMNKCEKAKNQLLRAKASWKGISGFDKRLEKLNNEIKNCVQHSV
jgi:tetratricopeptide (TPR) repeat protein